MMMNMMKIKLEKTWPIFKLEFQRLHDNRSRSYLKGTTHKVIFKAAIVAKNTKPDFNFICDHNFFIINPCISKFNTLYRRIFSEILGWAPPQGSKTL